MLSLVGSEHLVGVPSSDRTVSEYTVMMLHGGHCVMPDGFISQTLDL